VTPTVRSSGVRWWGPLTDETGYADEGRLMLRALALMGIPVEAKPMSRQGLLGVVPDDYLGLPLAPLNIGNVVDLAHLPWADPWVEGERVIWRTMFETDGLPDTWVARTQSCEQVWVPSRFNAESFVASGVRSDAIKVLPEPIDTNLFSPRPSARPRNQADTFRFLSIFRWQQRKGWDVLLDSYFAEFSKSDDVELLLRVEAFGPTVEFYPERLIAEAKARHFNDSSQAPSTRVLRKRLPKIRLPELYASADAFVLPSRGEGWGRPLMEAMAMGLPTLGTRWSGNLDFMTDENSFLIDAVLQPTSVEATTEWPIYRGQRWAEPSVDHLRSLMRRVRSGGEEVVQRSSVGRQYIHSNYGLTSIGRKIQILLSQLG
jgi:glycosyltransferase involved in cell wall biosynthesis